MSGDALVLRASYTGGSAAMVRKLDAMVQRGKRSHEAYAALGHRAMTLVTRGLRENIGHWPPPSSWARSYRAGGQPLLDTRRLSNSIAYKADAKGTDIGTNVPYAKSLNRGMTIRPKKRWLLIPLSPPLSQTEARAFPRGKEAIQARYPGSVFTVHGDDGPGIYRKVGFTAARSIVSARTRRGGAYERVKRGGALRAVRSERIAAAVRSVTLKRYGFLEWRPEWGRDLSKRYAIWYTDADGASGSPLPPSGGNPDTGPRGGQLG